MTSLTSRCIRTTLALIVVGHFPLLTRFTPLDISKSPKCVKIRSATKVAHRRVSKSTRTRDVVVLTATIGLEKRMVTKRRFWKMGQRMKCGIFDGLSSDGITPRRANAANKNCAMMPMTVTEADATVL